MWKYANLLVDDDLGDLAAARSLDPGYLMLQSITNMRGSRSQEISSVSKEEKIDLFFWEDSVLGSIPDDCFDSLQPPGKTPRTHFPSVFPYPCLSLLSPDHLSD
jgi:hypothetical protein